MSTLPGKTVLVTGGLAANGYLTSVGPSGALCGLITARRVDHEMALRQTSGS